MAANADDIEEFLVKKQTYKYQTRSAQADRPVAFLVLTNQIGYRYNLITNSSVSRADKHVSEAAVAVLRPLLVQIPGT